MKKPAIILIALAAFSGLFAGALTVLAQGYGLESTVQATGDLLPTTIAGANTIPKLIGRVVAIVLSLLGIVFFLIIFYGGICWMKARGNSDKVDEAKNMIEAAIIGLLIVLGSYAISNFVFTNLTGDGSADNSAATDTAVCAKEGIGATCGVNSFCDQIPGAKEIRCVSKCEIEGGKCGSSAACTGMVVKNLCPGGADNVCCKPK